METALVIVIALATHGMAGFLGWKLHEKRG